MWRDNREGFEKMVKQTRYENANQELANERGVLVYLKERGLDGAANMVERNIVSMERRVEKYRNEMTG